MKTPTTIIAPFPPGDGREWECQCARCGSSADWIDCDNCVDGYTDHDCGEDSCCHLDDPENYNVPCDLCHGHGGWWHCMSSYDYCNANPGEGRADVKRGQIEWYTFDAPDGEREHEGEIDP